MKRKHSARCIVYTNVESGTKEALYYIAGGWYLAGFEMYNADNPLYMIDRPIKYIIEDCAAHGGYPDMAVEKWVGLPIEQVKSKTFIRTWETNQEVYGVPF